MRNRVAIIGLGISGLACATRLAGHADLTLFDKSRGVSGRMSTRRADPFSFDHGAVYFRSSSDEFSAWLAPFIEDGVIVPWSMKRAAFDADGGLALTTDNVWVAAPAMNAIGKAVLKRLESQSTLDPDQIHLNTPIHQMEALEDGTHLLRSEGQYFGPFDCVISAIPNAQAADLIPDMACFHSQLSHPKMMGCHSLMLGFDDKYVSDGMAWDIGEFASPLIHKAVWNHRKPGRSAAKALLIQTKYNWSEPRLDWPKEDIEAAIIRELDAILPNLCAAATHRSVHSWRYAASAQGTASEDLSSETGDGFFWDGSLKLAAVGDWQLGAKVENGFLSGDRFSRHWVGLQD